MDNLPTPATVFLKAALSPLSFITPSGINHPYYAYTRSTIASQETMFARITSFPALGHEFVVPHTQDSVAFHVLLETESKQSSLEVQIWHNFNKSSSWDSLSLAHSEKPRLTVVQSQPNLHRTWFEGKLSGKPSHSNPVSFTVRFRNESSQNWKWAHDQSGVNDGQLLYQSPLKAIAEHKDLSLYVDGLGKDIKVERVGSETPNTTLWSLTAPAKGAQGEVSGFSTYRFGMPMNFVRWFSLVRLWSPWLAPRQGKDTKFADKDAILYSFLRHDGLHVVILTISGINDVTTIIQAQSGQLNIHARNDRDEEDTSKVVVAVAASFEAGLAACMYYARNIVSQHVTRSAEENEAIAKIKQLEAAKTQQDGNVKADWVQDWYDGFTYCTWNGLGQNLTEEKISGALSSLERNGIKISNLIIDDNWQSLDNEGGNQMIRGWKEFEANPKGFPQGLGTAVTSIRKKYPDIRHIGVWHAILGYWGGISPDGKLAQNYRTRQVQKRPDVIAIGDNKMLVIDEPDVKRMYNDFYTFLNQSGVDAVKTDAQFFLDEIQAAPDRRALTNTYLNTWVSAQLRHFGGLAISCMSQTPYTIFRCQLPTDIPAYPTRNSDDFFPDVEESHPWHIFCNAHNSLFTKHLNVLPDWDMFQTSHQWAGFHAAARCVSGGPIYVTDEPGHHNVNLISQMTAQTIRNQTVILRPNVIGRSTQAYIGFEEERLVKVGAYNGSAGTGTAFLGFFNCRNEGITEVIGVSDFIGTEAMKDGVVVRSHCTGACSPVLSVADNDVFAIQVEGRGYDVLSATPVFHAKDMKGLYAADLGLIGKMTGGAAIVFNTRYSNRSSGSSNGTNSDNGDSYDSATNAALVTLLSSKQSSEKKNHLVINTTLKALGTWGVYLLPPANHTIDIDADLLILLNGRIVPRDCVKLTSGKGMDGAGEGGGGVVLEVDVARAWKEGGFVVGWGNEVDVAAFLWL